MPRKTVWIVVLYLLIGLCAFVGSYAPGPLIQQVPTFCIVLIGWPILFVIKAFLAFF